MTTITENIDRLRCQIQRLEQQYGRSANSVSLLAVSKRHTAESIIEANQAGLDNFGENYLQEAIDKILKLQELGLNWHFIGPIQANKTRAIAKHFQWVHSVDRVKIAQRLSDQRDSNAPPLNICVQVNLSEEESKSGVTLNEAEALCDTVEKLPNLKLRGLMAIPAALDNINAQRQVFSLLASEFARLQPRYSQLDTLSMGMSNDFEAAIAEGSTLIRVGTSIFGPRS